MNSLAELIRVHPKSSPINVACEIVPGHYSKQYVVVEVRKNTIIKVDGVQKPFEVTATVTVCHACWDRWCYDCTNVSRELQRALEH
jgi:hypothetical protein